MTHSVTYPPGPEEDGIDAALKLCDKLTRFWANAGYDVGFRPIRRHVGGTAFVWGVTSSLGSDGRPRRIKRLSHRAGGDHA